MKFTDTPCEKYESEAFGVEVRRHGNSVQLSWHLKKEFKEQGFCITGFTSYYPYSKPLEKGDERIFYSNKDGRAIHEVIFYEWCIVHLEKEGKPYPPWVQFQFPQPDESDDDGTSPAVQAARTQVIERISALDAWEVTVQRIRERPGFQRLDPQEQNDMLLLLKERFLAAVEARIAEEEGETE